MYSTVQKVLHWTVVSCKEGRAWACACVLYSTCTIVYEKRNVQVCTVYPRLYAARPNFPAGAKFSI
jgi:hypothetical protein